MHGIHVLFSMFASPKIVFLELHAHKSHLGILQMMQDSESTALGQDQSFVFLRGSPVMPMLLFPEPHVHPRFRSSRPQRVYISVCGFSWEEIILGVQGSMVCPSNLEIYSFCITFPQSELCETKVLRTGHKDF